MNENQISAVVVDAALKIHRALGPGLLEHVYEATLAYELIKAGLWGTNAGPSAGSLRRSKIGRRLQTGHHRQSQTNH